MTTPNQVTRGQFVSLKTSLVNAVHNLFERELALRRKPTLSPNDEQVLAVLFAKRKTLQNAIAEEREAEINFLSSPATLEDANATLANATAEARAQLQRMADLQAALLAADQIVQIVTGLVTALRPL